MTEKELNKWYADTFQKPLLDYTLETYKIDLSSLTFEEQTHLVDLVQPYVSSITYPNGVADRPETEILTTFYFTSMTIPNQVLLEALYTLKERRQ